MGYDMHWRRRPAGEEAAVQEAVAAFHAACDARDDNTGTQADVQAASAAWDAAERSYFRLNIWGMSRVRPILAQAGAIYRHPHPEFPNPKEWGLTWGNVPGDETPVGQLTSVQLRFLAANREVLGTRDLSRGGFPDHKLGSNDGWLVSPDECRSAVTIWASYDQRAAVQNGVNPDNISLSDRFMRWVSEAADHDGFRVH